MEEFQRFTKDFDRFVPGISLDCVVFGYQNQTLHVLLLKWKRSAAWSLPGGFLQVDEEMEEAVNRVLLERTGLKDIFLRQFHTFSSLNRGHQKDAFNHDAFEHLFETLPKHEYDRLKSWFSQRFITTGYLALVNAASVNASPDSLSDTCEWKPIHDLPTMVYDHQEIIKNALAHIKIQLNYLPIGKSLLPEKFTMADLQFLYEAILQKPLDRANFQRKFLKLNVLLRHEKLMTGAANKAPYLYSFDDQAYFKLVRDGIGFSA